MLNDLLRQKKSIILGKWLDLILESYPANSAQFFRQERNQFANPVGYNLARDIESLFDAIVFGENVSRRAVPLDSIIRIRTVQDFAPSQVVRFIFLLKTAIRDISPDEINTSPNDGEWRALESRIDESALQAFDIYSQCREKINEIRINEIKARSFRFMEKTNQSSGISRTEMDSKSDDL